MNVVQTNPASFTTLTPAEARADELAIDCALVAFHLGLVRHDDGNGRAFAPAWDLLPRLVARGLVNVETREGCSPLVWLTEDAHEVIEDIIADGEFDQHVRNIRANRRAFAGRTH